MVKFIMSFGGAMLLIISSLSAQDFTSQQFDKPKKKNEFGLSYNERGGAGLTFKREIKENQYWRVDGSASAGRSAWANTHNIALSLGLENRMPITSKLSFYHGANLNFASVGNTQIPYQANSLSVGYRLGVRYDINKRFYVGAEINPQIGVARGSTITTFGNSTFISENNTRAFKTLGTPTLHFGVKF